MPDPLVTVVVPTLAAGDAMAECLRSLEAQTFDRWEVIVVDNSGTGLVQAQGQKLRVIRNQENVGFGVAINQGFLASQSPYLAVLNDDAKAHPRWLESLYKAAEKQQRTGMFASQVLLAGKAVLDSAGMLISVDGSSKQRGNHEPAAHYDKPIPTLLPSGSAALYRRAMLDEIGLFDDTFFLCEDTDLGLRARWAGWDCAYVPGAIVEHRYSHSAGTASPLKAYYVERNRLYMVIKNFPLTALLAVPFASVVRYFWHGVSLFSGQGKAGEFRQAGHAPWLLPFMVLRAHIAALYRLPRLLSARRRVRATRRITTREFQELLTEHSISLRQVAAL